MLGDGDTRYSRMKTLLSCLNTICVVLFGTPRWTHPHSLALTHSLCLSFALCVPNEWVEFIDDVEIDAADKA